MSIEEKLYEIYKEVDQKLASLIPAKNEILPFNEKATNPLYLNVEDDYEATDIEVMIFGQETNRWYGVFGENKDGKVFGSDAERIDSILYYYQYNFRDKNYRKKPFFEQGCEPFIKLFRSKNIGRQINYLWNNLIKKDANTNSRKTNAVGKRP